MTKILCFGATKCRILLLPKEENYYVLQKVEVLCKLRKKNVQRLFQGNVYFV